MPPKSPSPPPSARLATAFAPYYPRCEAHILDSRPEPVRPLCISDEALCRNPILDFDEQLHESNYNPRPDGSLADQPDGFSDPYLMPSLARNERLRLTMLWYYTRGLYDDREFVQLLQEKLDLVQTFMEWEFALLGLVSEDAFTRVAASGLPLAVLPRRESTCSHTITQEPGVSAPSPTCHKSSTLNLGPDSLHTAKHGQRLALQRVTTRRPRRPLQLRRSTAAMSDTHGGIRRPWISLRCLQLRTGTTHPDSGRRPLAFCRHARCRNRQPLAAGAPAPAQYNGPAPGRVPP